jgi:hypothetical protein
VRPGRDGAPIGAAIVASASLGHLCRVNPRPGTAQPFPP